MTNQPEALRLIQHMDDEWQEDWDGEAICAELRRLHMVNQELLEALENLLWYVGQLEAIVYSADDTGEHEEVTKARAVINKAEKNEKH
jgi:hypothetical protein